jgi:hypothetical protein
MASAASSLPEPVTNCGTLAARSATDWLTLGAAPTFAAMAALTGLAGGGAHATLCIAAPGASVLTAMAPMYGLMSVFHLAPWLRFIAGRRADGPSELAGRTRHPPNKEPAK